MGILSDITMGRLREGFGDDKYGKIFYEIISKLNEKVDSVEIAGKDIHISTYNGKEISINFGENKEKNLNMLKKFCRQNDIKDITFLQNGRSTILSKVGIIDRKGVKVVTNVIDVSNLRPEWGGKNDTYLSVLSEFDTPFGEEDFDERNDFEDSSINYIFKEIQGEGKAISHKEDGSVDVKHLYRDLNIMLNFNNLGKVVAVFEEHSGMKYPGFDTPKESKDETLIVLRDTGFATIYRKSDVDDYIKGYIETPQATSSYYMSLDKIISLEVMANYKTAAREENQVMIYAPDDMKNGIRTFCEKIGVDKEQMNNTRLEDNGVIRCFSPSSVINGTSIRNKYDKMQETIDNGYTKTYQQEDVVNFFKDNNIFEVLKNSAYSKNWSF